MAASPLDRLEPAERTLIRRARMPARPTPMLATLTDERFDSPDWIYERKLDGVRLLVRRKQGRVRLLTRNGLRRESTFPEIAEALTGVGPDCIVDGEVVAFAGNVTSFQRLQGRIGITDADEARGSGIAVYLYCFDILHCDGHDVTRLPLHTRKRLLDATIRFRTPIRRCPHRNTTGRAYLREACRKGWEGVIAKRVDSRYVHRRSRDWLKFKCVREQELVIGGWTDPGGSRHGFGALLLGYFDGSRLRYAGRVGTGFSEDQLAAIHARLARLERQAPPFVDAGEERGRDDVHWAAPRLVAEVGFTEWTREGRLRHPRFLGLRDDKPAREVVRERPA